ncbi:hypothetical protein GLW04_17730 [Halobacillus litoralis]|uniref:Uncharacterized protein n=1 Tax=Halobacillus litoralis TaxID=45668 RepID=A0A845DVN6_9BACI|nr:hypothetical protein [Halobacillus litoralis]MYL21743.1 hypothetical protein [Halobacillus litoralis]
MKENLFRFLENSQGAVILPLLRKNEWAEIAERGFCEEARALVRGKGRITATGGKKEKACKKQGFLYNLTAAL